MTVKYTDNDIEMLLEERKFLPPGISLPIRFNYKSGNKQKDIDIQGENGNHFRLIMRLNDNNPLDFSIILAFLPLDSSQDFKLRRYNGLSHEHTNKLEKQTFYAFHMHQATERYQDHGYKEETFAVPTERYSDFDGALNCALKDCGFDVLEVSQMTMFGGDV